MLHLILIQMPISSDLTYPMTVVLFNYSAGGLDILSSICCCRCWACHLFSVRILLESLDIILLLALVYDKLFELTKCTCFGWGFASFQSSTASLQVLVRSNIECRSLF